MESSDFSSGMLGEEAQMAPGSSMSYGDLVQQSTAILQNECLILGARIEKTSRDVEETKQLCARQSENIAKQQSELEHYKIKTHNEEMQNNSHLSKIRNLREKLQVLDKYFKKFEKTINPMLGYKTDLEEKIMLLKRKLVAEETLNKHVEKENQFYLEEAHKAFLNLQECKDKEKTEFIELKAHLTNQLEQQKLQKKELEQDLREVQGQVREKDIMIEILEPQREELIQTNEKLKTELAAAKEEMNTSCNQLETSLQQGTIRKNQLFMEIETLDQNINELNIALRDKEAEIRDLDANQKQLNAEEEEYTKICKYEEQELQELEAKVEELTSQLSACMKVETENITLKADCEKLQIESNNYQKKIADMENSEDINKQKVEELSKYFNELELEREQMINEKITVEDAIKKLEKEQEDIESEHKDLSLKINKTSVDLQDENNQLEISLQDLSAQLLEASETENEFEKSLKDLEAELAEAEAIFQESEFKLSSFKEETNSINKGLNEEIQILSESLEKSIEDHEKAVSDCKQNEEVKKEILQLEIDLESKQVQYAQLIQEIQDSYAKEIENKSKLMEESRAQCEREYRIKEAMKTDAMVDLKETKARIIELGKQIALVEKEIAVKADLMRKCDSLIQKMMSKFNKVAQVAASSQSVADTASQQASTFVTPKVQRKPVKVESPGSDSSGRTFKPDEVDFKNFSQARQPLRTLPAVSNPRNMAKKRNASAQPTKKAAQDQDDPWGGLI